MQDYTQIIGRQGIYKESRQFFAVEVSDVIFENEKCSLKLTLLGNRYAEYKNGPSFEDIPLTMERKFEFGYIDFQNMQEQLENGEEILFFYVMYIGDLVLGDHTAFDKFQKEDATFWEDYI